MVTSDSEKAMLAVFCKMKAENQLALLSLFKKSAASVVVVLLAACASAKLEYDPPAQRFADNSKTVQRPRDQVWAAAVPAIGKQFYVINNVDRSSGLINLSFGGNPDKYVDCGMMHNTYETLNGDEKHDFPGASPDQYLRVWTPPFGTLGISQRLELDGRVNLIFEELAPSSTRVTANVRYVLKRSMSIQGGSAPQIPVITTHSIGFNSGGGDAFPAIEGVAAMRCVATGELEKNLLLLIQQN